MWSVKITPGGVGSPPSLRMRNHSKLLPDGVVALQPPLCYRRQRPRHNYPALAICRRRARVLTLLPSWPSYHAAQLHHPSVISGLQQFTGGLHEIESLRSEKCNLGTALNHFSTCTEVADHESSGDVIPLVLNLLSSSPAPRRTPTRRTRRGRGARSHARVAGTRLAGLPLCCWACQRWRRLPARKAGSSTALPLPPLRLGWWW
eukprot:COSAG02_NODE_13659_length_1366_cov_1.048145_1_plen_204_part_00